ncbi:hypothetical protein MCC02030_16280 [Bifidobacteriaceae bacterium MCC02030]|nr:hypothetical protein MCC02030_16280 [Bifidobacteriaceae bacterium MCC02030]
MGGMARVAETEARQVGRWVANIPSIRNPSLSRITSRTTMSTRKAAAYAGAAFGIAGMAFGIAGIPLPAGLFALAAGISALAGWWEK